MYVELCSGVGVGFYYIDMEYLVLNWIGMDFGSRFGEGFEF